MYIKNAFEYLSASAGRFSDKLAFAEGGEGVTFGELESGAIKIGSALAGMGCRAARPVAVLCERSVDAVRAFMGVLAAGCFYVPLDRKMPKKRLENILRRLSPEAILCESEKDAEGLPFDAVPISALSDAEPDPQGLAARRERVLDLDPVYMIFTSGSTGEPKGIVIPHRALIDFLEWMAPALDITEKDVMGNQAPFYFDLSVKDLWLTIKCGATAHIIPRKCFMFPKLLVEELSARSVTTLIWSTSAFSMTASSGILDRAVPKSVKKVILGGETLYARDLNVWRRALPEAVFVNLYGPTEVTVDCTYYVIDREFSNGEQIPIGRACENMEIMLLDSELKPVKKGETGEICVRGSGIARGYFADPERTAGAFIQNPMNPYWRDIIYRTGDLAHEGEDGLLYFSSRADGQIKHLGYRIEIGEIETALSAVEGVRSAVCFFDGEADRIVCAYEGDAAPGEITSRLREHLPGYMLPNIYRQYDSLPRNQNGKADRPGLRREYEDDKSRRL